MVEDDTFDLAKKAAGPDVKPEEKEGECQAE